MIDHKKFAISSELCSKDKFIRQSVASGNETNLFIQTTPNCARRARLGVANSIESVVSIERLFEKRCLSTASNSRLCGCFLHIPAEEFAKRPGVVVVYTGKGCDMECKKEI